MNWLLNIETMYVLSQQTIIILFFFYLKKHI